MTKPINLFVRMEAVNKFAGKNKTNTNGGAQKTSGETLIITRAKVIQRKKAINNAGKKFFRFLIYCILIYHVLQWHP